MELGVGETKVPDDQFLEFLGGNLGAISACCHFDEILALKDREQRFKLPLASVIPAENIIVIDFTQIDGNPESTRFVS